MSEIIFDVLEFFDEIDLVYSSSLLSESDYSDISFKLSVSSEIFKSTTFSYKLELSPSRTVNASSIVNFLTLSTR